MVAPVGNSVLNSVMRETMSRVTTAVNSSRLSRKRAARWDATLATYEEPITSSLPVQAIDTALRGLNHIRPRLRTSI
jgi:hypothetical protein